MSDNRRCCVISCAFSKKRISGVVRLYGLPKDASTLRQWHHWIAKENGPDFKIKSPSHVCSNHFAEDVKGIRKLRRGAIPTLSSKDVSGAESNAGTSESHPTDQLDLQSGAESNAGTSESHPTDQLDLQSGAESNAGTSESHPTDRLDLQSGAESNAGTSESHPTDQLDQSNPFVYSSIVEIDINHNDAKPILSEPVVYLEEAEILSKSEALHSATDNSAGNFEPERNLIMENMSRMFFVINSDGSLSALDQPEVSCVVDAPDSSHCVQKSFEGGDQSNLLCAYNNESFNLQILFEETVSEKNIEDSTNQLPEESFDLDLNIAAPGSTTNPLLDERIDLVSNIAAPDRTSNEPNNLLFRRTEEVKGSLVQSNKVKTNNSRKCFAHNCSNPNKKTIHTFPAIVINGQINQDNLKRCKEWTKSSGNIELLQVFSSKLHGRYGLCSDHFDDRQFYNHQTRKRLLPNAIPTLNFSNPISDIDMKVFPKWAPADIFADIENTEIDGNLSEAEIGQQDNDPDANEPDVYQKKFEDTMNTLEWRTCNRCKEKFFTKKSSKKICCHSKPICLALSEENGFDPGDVPPELQNLTSIEEQLISIIHPVVQVCKVKGHQYSYKGNIINFPQDVKKFATKLPHNIHELQSIVKVRTSKDAENYKDFHVRGDVVRNALVWLQASNPYYFDIQISEENVNILPKDGNVYDLIQGLDLNEEEEELENVDEDGVVSESNVPMLSVPGEEEQIANVIEWPQIGKTPIDEFKEVDGYVVKAFPTLFPCGVCDLGHARRKKVSDTSYFQHLMRYHDERFAKHNRFRFFALNSLMRWSALTDGNIFIKRNPEFQKMTVKDLREKLDKDPSLMRKIMFQGNNIRGTNAFWHARGRELKAMVEQMGLATLFFTLSAADMHWPDLYKLLAPDENPETMTEYRRRELIQQNPLIVDEFFLTRCETFLQEVLTPKYKIKDFWFRIEYQHRGSPHLHGLLWLDNAPDVSNILDSTEEEKDEVIEYFDKLISTMHPNINEPPAPKHPCRTKLSEVQDLKQDLAQLLNRVQRHTICTPGYCLKKGNPPKCRFNFPAPMQESSQLDFSEEKNIKFVPARNDSRLNKFNPYIIRTWRGNIDVSPVLSKQALINYLAKYVSKSETRSQDLIDLMKRIIDDSDEKKPAKHALQRIFIKTCSERDYSAQETCHILMGLKLYSRGDRNFVSINFNETAQWQQVRKDGKSAALSMIDRYKSRRGEDNEMTCLWNMAKFHKVKNPEKFNIIMVYPTIKIKPSSQDNEAFFKQQCLLFVPWRDQTTLQGTKSWEEVYQENLELIEQNRIDCISLEGQPDRDMEYDEFDHEILPREQWMAISAMRSNQQTAQVQLGFRQIDMNKNWHASLAKYNEVGGIPYLQSFLSNAKQNCETNNTSNNHFQFDLAPEQLKVVELAQLQILKCLNKSPAQTNVQKIPKKVIVQGKAGTGKSVIVSEIVRLAETQLGQGSVVVLGPTGVSAVNVNGSTIQSKLKINSRKKNEDDEFVPLKGQAAHDLAQVFKTVKFVIFDEFSMIGCSLLSKIDQRLRQATGKANEDFGGLNCYFFGDIKQLSPVADCAAYSTNQKSLPTIRGKQLYNNMDAAFILTKIHRQNNTEFLEVLNNISMGKVTMKDYNFLSSRFTYALSSSELKVFRNALHLYPTVDKVQQFNRDCLETLQNTETKEPVPVACVTAKHNTAAASRGTITVAEGLEPVLYLAEGAKIMLRVNLWTEKGLVNGAMGEIEDIIYDENAHPSHDPPSVLICKFPSYKGPYLDPEKKTVPIIPLTKSWVNEDGINCSREQFPLTLAYSTTIHKSQGLTLLMAYVDIGHKEMSPGLTYVALSRVKSISGLAIAPFSYQRLKSLSKSIAIQKRIAWEQLLQSKLQTNT